MPRQARTLLCCDITTAKALKLDCFFDALTSGSWLAKPKLSACGLRVVDVLQDTGHRLYISNPTFHCLVAHRMATAAVSWPYLEGDVEGQVSIVIDSIVAGGLVDLQDSASLLQAVFNLLAGIL